MRRRRLIVAACSLILVFAVAAVIVAAERHVRNVGNNLMRQPADSSPAPVAIVLGAQVYKNGRLSAALEDRVATAIDLYKGGKVEKLLMSGDSERPQKYDEVGAMVHYALKHGVPETDILTDPLGLRTFDSMARASSEFDISEAIIVTQRFHMPRSLFLAHKMGIAPRAAVADRRQYTSEYVMGWREYMARVVAWFDVIMA